MVKSITNITKTTHVKENDSIDQDTNHDATAESAEKNTAEIIHEKQDNLKRNTDRVLKKFINSKAVVTESP